MNNNSHMDDAWNGARRAVDLENDLFPGTVLVVRADDDRAVTAIHLVLYVSDWIKYDHSGSFREFKSLVVFPNGAWPPAVMSRMVSRYTWEHMHNNHRIFGP